MKLVEATESDYAEWDEFITSQRIPHHEQLSSWGKLQQLRGWESVIFIVRSGAAIVAGVLMLVRPVLRVSRVCFINRGPVWDGQATEPIEFLVNSIKDFARRRRISYVAVNPPYVNGAESLLSVAGFVAKPACLPPVYPEAATAIIDLNPTEDDLLGRMRSTTRNYIRQSLKRGVVVRDGDRSDLVVFGQLVEILCARRGVSPNVPTDDFLTSMWDLLAPSGQMKLFISEFEGRPLGGLVVLPLGRWARAWRIGWSGTHANQRPNEAIYWSAIRWAKANGHAYFDVMGVDPGVAVAVLEGRPPPTTEYGKLAAFKLGLGAIPMLLAPGSCYVRNWGLRLALGSSRSLSHRSMSTGSTKIGE